MKNLTMNLIQSVVSVLFISSPLWAATTPSVHKVKVYELWLSTSEYCTSPIKVIDNGESASEVDVVQNLNLGQASLPPAGTYKCLIIVASDTMKLTPAENDGTHCVAGTEFVADTCSQVGSLGAYPLPDETSTTCDSGENKTAVYFSTASTNPTGYQDLGFYPPTESDGTRGMTLAGGEIVIAASDVTKTMYVDCTNKISDNGTNCQMGACTLGFR